MSSPELNASLSSVASSVDAIVASKEARALGRLGARVRLGARARVRVTARDGIVGVGSGFGFGLGSGLGLG